MIWFQHPVNLTPEPSNCHEQMHFSKFLSWRISCLKSINEQKQGTYESSQQTHTQIFTHNLGESYGSNGLAEPPYVPLGEKAKDHDLVFVAIVLGKVTDLATSHYDIHARLHNCFDLLQTQRVGNVRQMASDILTHTLSPPPTKKMHCNLCKPLSTLSP